MECEKKIIAFYCILAFDENMHLYILRLWLNFIFRMHIQQGELLHVYLDNKNQSKQYLKAQTQTAT